MGAPMLFATSELPQFPHCRKKIRKIPPWLPMEIVRGSRNQLLQSGPGFIMPASVPRTAPLRTYTTISPSVKILPKTQRTPLPWAALRLSVRALFA